MGKKRTKIFGAEEFEGLAPEDLLKRPKKMSEKRTEKPRNLETKQLKVRKTAGQEPSDMTSPTEDREDQPRVEKATSQEPAKPAVEATKEEIKKAVAKRKKITRKRVQGQAYQEALSKIDRQKIYPLTEAIDTLKKIAYAKFDQTVELHVHTLSKKGQEPIRFILVLPAGAVKLPRVRIIDEVALQDIESGKVDFDISIATPSVMPKLAKFAKVLGPRGLMPNPKAGTVTDDPQKVLEQFQKGQIEVRSDSLGNIHVGLAKLSWEINRIVENVRAILSHIPTNRIGSVTLTATMAPGLKVAV